ncbi:hypothetical protein PC116_g23249 [Phytophthora cactorum]|nr:hypothetical protein PC116_g23249 [Phytophthora cactorum]
MPRRQYATVDDVDMEDMIENDKEEEKLSGIPMDLQDSGKTDRIDPFKEGRITGELDFAKVKSIMSSRLRMDVVLVAANSRVSNLSHEMYQILEMENMEWMVKREPKKIVNYRIDALTSRQLQLTVRGEKVCESNKSVLKNVVAFIYWLRTCPNESYSSARL